MDRRAFLEAMTVAAASGLPLASRPALAADGDALYDLPRFGNVSLLHFTDCHAQLLPQHFREPNVNLGMGPAAGRPPHLVGEALLRASGIAPLTREAHAFTYLDFSAAAKLYGQAGGLRAHRHAGEALKASRPGALLSTAETAGRARARRSGRARRTWSMPRSSSASTS
jgi:sulfur-oxidizing protein SoxB